jgi:hypothetical protein
MQQDIKPILSLHSVFWRKRISTKAIIIFLKYVVDEKSLNPRLILLAEKVSNYFLVDFLSLKELFFIHICHIVAYINQFQTKPKRMVKSL